jgi:hypothetical protein
MGNMSSRMIHRPLNASRQPLTPPVPAVEVTLTSLASPTTQPSNGPHLLMPLPQQDDLDDFTERRFVIAPNTTVHVGRSSKNATKGLLATPDNVYINSPVISRKHASFTTSLTQGIHPNVFITDHNSMHGTKVNNTLVVKDKAHKLHDGDTLQFGMDVVRDQGMTAYPSLQHVRLTHLAESFVAKKYHFRSQLAPVPFESSFPRRISVPSDASFFEDDEDDEDDDSEDISFVRSSQPASSYGSHANPVNIDDFEDGHSDIEEPEKGIAQQAPTKLTAPMSTVKANLPLTIISLQAVPNAKAGEGPKEPSSDIENELFGSSRQDAADSQEDYETDGSEDNSDIECGSAFESESEEGNGPAVLREMKLSAMLAQDHAKPDGNGVSENPQTPSAGTLHPSSLSMQPVGSTEPAKLFTPSPAVHITSKSEDSSFANVYANHQWAVPGPSSVPARPSAPKLMSFDPYIMDYGTTTPPFNRETPHPWYEGSVFGIPPRSGFTPEYIPNPSTAPPKTVSSSSTHLPNSNSEERDTLAKPRASFEYDEATNETTFTAPWGVLTPPLPTSKDTSSANALPNARTKVSIAEIVDNPQQQQPHTPTSVSPPATLKRKADDLEDTAIVGGIQESAAADVVEGHPITSIVAARPKKRLRAALSFLGTAAAGAFVGGVAVSAALIAIPESFLQG